MSLIFKYIAYNIISQNKDENNKYKNMSNINVGIKTIQYERDHDCDNHVAHLCD